MTLVHSSQDFLDNLLEGLKQRKINFVVTRNSLGCKIDEVFIGEARVLVILPNGVLNQDVIRWILEIRTPLKVRLIIFVKDVNEYKIRVMRSVSDLKNEGVLIPNIEHSISIHERSDQNLQRMLESLENWLVLRTHGRPLPNERMKRVTARQSASYSPPSSRNFSSPLLHQSLMRTAIKNNQAVPLDNLHDLHIHLRNAIKTYWTEHYLARYLHMSVDKARDLAQRIGIHQEICGKEVLYFFNRTEALSTYFVHILKGVLEELDIKYEETGNETFFLPDFHIAIKFFDGDKEQLRTLAENYVKTHDLIFVVPERLRIKIGKIQDDFFQVIPLSQNSITSILQQLIRRRTKNVKPLSSK